MTRDEVLATYGKTDSDPSLQVVVAVCEAINRELGRRRMTQSDLARRIGRPRQSVSSVLTGASGHASTKTLARMVDELGEIQVLIKPWDEGTEDAT